MPHERVRTANKMKRDVRVKETTKGEDRPATTVGLIYDEVSARAR